MQVVNGVDRTREKLTDKYRKRSAFIDRSREWPWRSIEGLISVIAYHVSKA